jgi:hypothetical protein
MKKKVFVLIVITSLILAACGVAKSSESAVGGIAPQADYSVEERSALDQAASNMAPAPAMEAPAEGAPSSLAAPDQAAMERLVVKNANLTLIVPDSKQSMQEVTQMAEAMGGFVVNSYLYKSTDENGNEYTDASITIRVPVDKLSEALDRMHGLVSNPKTDILSENVTGEDVTSTVVDLESRLRNYENVVEKLTELMEEAKKTDEALNVFNQMIYYQEQIEILQGQIKYYRESAAMSAISASLTEKPAVTPVTIGGWQPQGIARDAIQALIEFLQWLANLLIWLGLFCLPISLLIYIPIYFTWKSMKRKGWVWKGWRPVKPTEKNEEAKLITKK